MTHAHTEKTTLHQDHHKVPTLPKKPQEHVSTSSKFGYAIGVTLWVVFSFALANLVLIALFKVLAYLNISLNFIGETVLQTVLAVVVYVLALICAIGVPYWARGLRTSLKEVGLAQTMPRWRDIGLAPLVFIACLLTSGIAVFLLTKFLPGFDAGAKQDVGFQNISQRYEMLLAYFTLCILAPVCEELLFRGYMFGKLRNRLSAPWTILLTAVIFGSLHLPGADHIQWNVAVDTFILAIGLGLLREYTKSIWAGILVHMIKNTLAFFILFIAPLLNISLIQ